MLRESPGKPAEILVVSGLPRSGTSLMMRMLQAGGVELVTDGVRAPDADNPGGYFELERVRSLAHDSAWLGAAQGKALKVISALLRHLPVEHRYRVLLLRRDLDEVLASQAQMLERRGVPRDPAEDVTLRADFAAHLAATQRWLHRSAAFEVHEVSYAGLIDAPGAELERVASFLGRDLDLDAMRACVDPALYRARAAGRSVSPDPSC